MGKKIEELIKGVIEDTIIEKRQLQISRPDLKKLLIIKFGCNSLMYDGIAKRWLANFEGIGKHLRYWRIDDQKNALLFIQENEFVQILMEKIKK